MASTDSPKTILLRGTPLQIEKANGASALVPGDFVVTNSSNTLSWPTHGAASKPAYVVKERDWTGKGIDDAYGSGDQVPLYVAKSGDQVYARLKASQLVSVGTLLMAAGTDGTLQLVTSGGTPVARAVAAVASVASIQRVKVEIL